MPLLAELQGVRTRLARVVFPEAWAPRLIVSLATLLVALSWALPGLLLPMELVQDASGHLAAAQTLRDDFLPAISGWNAHFFAGFPQDRAYPPLAHAAMALLGLLLPLGLALRVVLAAAVLATPAAAAAFARSRGVGDARAALYALLVTALLCVTPDGDAMLLAGSFPSLYNIGLTANAVALPLMLLAAAALPRALTSRRGTPGAALLVSAAALTHLVCGMALALLCLCETAVLVSRGGRRAGRALRGAVRLALACAALAAGWLVTFVNESGYGGVAFIPSLTPWWIVLPVALAAVLHLRRRMAGGAPSVRSADAARPLRSARRLDGTLLFSVALLALLFVGDAMKLPMHLYRLHLFVLLGAGLCGVAALRGRRVLVGVGVVVAALGIACCVNGPRPVDMSARDTLVVPGGRPPERVLVAASPLHEPTGHYLEHEYPRRAGTSALLGLFVESTPLARWVGDLTAAIEPDSSIWGTSWDVGPVAELAQGLMPEAAGRNPQAAARAVAQARRWLHEFGVDAVLTDRRLPSGVVEPDGPVIYRFPAQGDTDPRYVIEDDAYVFRLLAVTGAAQLAQPVTKALDAVPWSGRAAWDLVVRDWLLADGDPSRPVAARPGLDVSPAPPEVRVSSCRQSADGRELQLQIESPVDVPILVRVAWHPGWRASCEGRELPVDRVAPGFCLVRGHGAVRLSWGPSVAELAANGVSASALALACLWAAGNRLKRGGRSRRQAA